MTTDNVYELNQFNQNEFIVGDDYKPVITTKKEDFYNEYKKIVNSLNDSINETLFNPIYEDLEKCFVCDSNKIPIWNFILFDNKLLITRCNRATASKSKKQTEEEETEETEETERKVNNRDNSIQVYIPQVLRAYNLTHQSFLKWKKSFIKLNEPPKKDDEEQEKPQIKICDNSNKWLYVNMLVPFLSSVSVDFITRLTNKAFFDMISELPVKVDSKAFKAESIVKATATKSKPKTEFKKIVISNVITEFKPDKNNLADVKAANEEKDKPLNPKIIVVDDSIDLSDKKYTGIKEKIVKKTNPKTKEKTVQKFTSQARRKNLVIEHLPTETTCKVVFEYLKKINSDLIDTEKEVSSIIGCIPLKSNVSAEQFKNLKSKLPSYLNDVAKAKHEEAEKKKAEQAAKKAANEEKRAAKKASKQTEAKPKAMPTKPEGKATAKPKAEPKKKAETKKKAEPKKVKNITDDIGDLDDDFDLEVETKPTKPKSKATPKSKKQEESEESEEFEELEDDKIDEIEYDDNIEDDMDDF